MEQKGKIYFLPSEVGRKDARDTTGRRNAGSQVIPLRAGDGEGGVDAFEVAGEANVGRSVDAM